MLRALILALCSLSLHASAQQKVIRVWHTETQPNSQEAMRNIAKRFEAQNLGVRRGRGARLGRSRAAHHVLARRGHPPELSHGQPITCAALQSKGLLLPLDEVVSAIGEANIWDQVKRVCRVGRSSTACARRGHLAPHLPQGPRRSRPQAAEDLGRPRRQRQGVQRARHGGHHHSRRQPVHQHPARRADQGERRRSSTGRTARR